MGLSLDLRLTFVPKTVSDFLSEASKVRDMSHRSSKLDDFVKRLEDEMRKIDAFKRELPLCMLLLNEAIVRLKEEMEQCADVQDGPLVQEFIPVKKTKSKEEDLNRRENKNWSQLWTKSRGDEEARCVSGNLIQTCNEKNSGGAFVPYKGDFGFSKRVVKEEKEASQISSLSLLPPMSELNSTNSISKSSSSRGSSGSYLFPDPIKLHGRSQKQLLQQTSKKQRRCWSPELHRRFVDALEQLGGAQVATPKEIRELMQVVGLTNDEVKSHLQKYRLHVSRLPPSSVAPENGSFWMAQDHCGDKPKATLSKSGPPQDPLLVGGSAKGVSGSRGNCVDAEEDEKSDDHSWKDGFDHQEEVDL